MKSAVTTSEHLWKVWDEEGNEGQWWVWYECQAIEAFAQKFGISTGHIIRTESLGEQRYRYAGTKTGYR